MTLLAIALLIPLAATVSYLVALVMIRRANRRVIRGGETNEYGEF